MYLVSSSVNASIFLYYMAGYLLDSPSMLTHILSMIYIYRERERVNKQMKEMKLAIVDDKMEIADN